MGLIIDKEDFVGQYAISQNDYSKLPDYITQFETRYIYEFYGKELADLFIANLSGQVPQDARFTVLFEVGTFEIGGCNYSSIGMLNMMLGFVYYEYMRKDPIKSTVTGQVRNANENSTPVIDTVGITTRYNDSVNTYKILQAYMIENSTTYPEFAGVKKETALWF